MWNQLRELDKGLSLLCHLFVAYCVTCLLTLSLSTAIFRTNGLFFTFLLWLSLKKKFCFVVYRSLRLCSEKLTKSHLYQIKIVLTVWSAISNVIRILTHPRRSRILQSFGMWWSTNVLWQPVHHLPCRWGNKLFRNFDTSTTHLGFTSQKMAIFLTVYMLCVD
jgi:hypothetical protein